jgi:hypothetical protein
MWLPELENLDSPIPLFHRRFWVPLPGPSCQPPKTDSKRHFRTGDRFYNIRKCAGDSIFSSKNEPGERIYFSHKMSLEAGAK